MGDPGTLNLMLLGLFTSIFCGVLAGAGWLAEVLWRYFH